MIGVAKEVAGLRIDDVSVYAALLHEVVNHGGATTKEVEENFGEEINND